ncbi:MAG: DEAD/DEAH box helicase family protein [Candidatus Nanohaloarchaeota archaeon QJJ-9]|nr:DEAD/DEAH box helicase family protein [Candidatus Nanohaloarchaeota archaeon QJJ-9]
MPRRLEIDKQDWNRLKDEYNLSDSFIEEFESQSGQEHEIYFFEENREIIVINPEEKVLKKLGRVSHLEASSGELYKFKVSRMDVWNSDLELEELEKYFKEILGEERPKFIEWVERIYKRQQVFSIEKKGHYYVLKSTSEERMNYARNIDEVENNLVADLNGKTSRIAPGSNSRAKIKEALIDKGYPVQDNYEFKEVEESIGAELECELRPYQKNMLEKAWKKKACVLANPSGSGKTVTAIGMVAKVDSPTLILVPQRSLIPQWKEELQDKLSIDESQIGEYHGDKKEIGDITLATYHIASSKTSIFRKEWGLIVFDECLSGDTVIETKEGKKTFNELDKDLDLEKGWNRDVELEVRTFDGGYEWDAVKGIYKTEAPIESIETNTGKVLKATPNHTHLVFDPKTFEIEEVKEVSEGDFLIQPLEHLSEEPGEDEHPKAELMGWFLGDGHMNDSGAAKFSFARNAEEQVGILKDLCDEIGADYSVYDNSRGDLTIYIKDFQDRLLCEDFPSDKTHSVEVPEEFYTASKERIGALLRGLFDAEGSVGGKKRVEFDTTSHKLAKDVDLLLQKLGIMTRQFKIEKDGRINDVYRLYIPSYYNDLFEKWVGFRMEHKEKRVEKGGNPATAIPASDFLSKLKSELSLTEYQLADMMKMSRGNVNSVLRDRYRLGQEELKKLAKGLEKMFLRDERESSRKPEELREEYNITYRELSENTDFGTAAVFRKWKDKEEEALSSLKEIVEERRDRAEKFVEKIKEVKDLNLLEVQDIEEKEEQTVYDLETDTHTFLADGFLTHNCHHIPASIFRKTADLQSTRRIGLSATPVREDSKEKEIFTLIGPEIGGDWGFFFKGGHVLRPEVEIQFVPWSSEGYRRKYEKAEGIKKHIVASKNPRKMERLEDLLEEHSDEKAIIFCDWIEQANRVSNSCEFPCMTGETDHDRREELLEKFREGELDRLAVSRVGDEGIDVPDADLCIVMSGQGGSRRQATQRAGRVMRPQGNSKVYFIATKGSVEEDYVRRQMELMKEKGIEVTVEDFAD